MLHACIQLYSVVPAGEMTAVQLYCQPLRVSMVSMLRPASPCACIVGGGGGGGWGAVGGASAADFFRSWSALPARAEVTGENGPPPHGWTRRHVQCVI